MLRKKKYKHKLVTIGDSLSQGFNNGGIYRTDLSFPSFLADSLDITNNFDQPLFTAQAGIPLNLEVLTRGIADKYGNQFSNTDYLRIIRTTYKTLKRIKKYWEGRMINLARNQASPYHNQSIWGFSINDAWLVNAKNSREFVENQKDRYSVMGVLPEHAKFTTARLVLNPTLTKRFESYTQLDNVNYLANNGGVENLIICTGHNNILGAVVNLNLKWSEPDDLEKFVAERDYTIYRPEHFEAEYRKLAGKISKMNIKNVFVPTIPYPTIPPICRGVNADITKVNRGYFDYYTRFWIWDSDFNPDKHPHLTKEEAIQIDQTADAYNEIINRVAKEYDWHVVPVADHVSAMARRRLGGRTLQSYPEDFIKALKRNPNTAYLVDENNKVTLTTDFLRTKSDSGEIYKGGIFSLDGIHPTTIAYGLMANVYRDVMQENGVRFKKPLDWDFIISEDSLITHPPILLKELKLALRFLALDNQDKFMAIGRDLYSHLMGLFARKNTP